MHGLGNDFIVINSIKQKISLSASDIQHLANRHTGIGFDQLLVIDQSNKADFACKIFNADGSEAEQCGNGMRCVARFLQEEGLTKKNAFRVETKAGIIPIHVHNFDNIEVTMGIPIFEPAKIPLLITHEEKLYDIEVGTQSLKMTALSMGNPHAVLQVDNVKNYPVKEMGAIITKHALFPHGVNVGFMEILNNHCIRLRTFERGSGETLACGSNTCAAVVAGIINYQLANEVTVELALGNLVIKWDGKERPVIMCGPAKRVFKGILD